eukprot:2281057-Pleurochrysis_carterae.AAC.2
MLVIAWCAHVARVVGGLVISAHKASCLARCGGPELGRLAQRLLKRLGLRCRRLALDHGRIERRRLQAAVGVATGKQLGE